MNYFEQQQNVCMHSYIYVIEIRQEFRQNVIYSRKCNNCREFSFLFFLFFCSYFLKTNIIIGRRRYQNILCKYSTYILSWSIMCKKITKKTIKCSNHIITTTNVFVVINTISNHVVSFSNGILNYITTTTQSFVVYCLFICRQSPFMTMTYNYYKKKKHFVRQYGFFFFLTFRKTKRKNNVFDSIYTLHRYNIFRCVWDVYNYILYI